MSDDHIPEPTTAGLTAWGTITTHLEFGQRTAEWLTGQRTYHPAYADDSPADETQPMLDELAEINRLGFVTDGSQPGVELDAWGSGQRAYVTGYCDGDTARVISEALSTTDLVVISFAQARPETRASSSRSTRSRSTRGWDAEANQGT